jgi:hypothetical protein
MEKKNTENNGQTTTRKIEDWETRISLKIMGELKCSGRVNISCSTSGIRIYYVHYSQNVHNANTKQLHDMFAVNIYNSDKFIIFIFETQNRTQARLCQHTHAHFVLLTCDEM